jgi:Na+-translocating ferredoxin:NAD+ oxidoreductase subunit C
MTMSNTALKTFKIGGVHPPENKFSEHEKIEVLPLPDKVFMLCGQVLGAPSVPIVKKGDIVKSGQLIAKGEAFISAHIHAPVTGTVSKIDDITDSSGYKRQTIIIENIVEDEWEDGIDSSADITYNIPYNPGEIIEKIKAAGIVGLGGATFPSHVKLMVPDGKKIEVLLINGVECEPYLTADHRMMLEKGEEILIGTQILMKGLQVHKAVIGIENNKPDAIAHMSELAEKFEGIRIQPLKVKYPQGGEKQLIKAVTGREVPSGKLPLEVGCVVNNVGTAFAVYEAVQKNKPLIERVVTITGKSLKKSANYLVRLGTPISVLIEKAGGLPDDTGKIISGGPMMGKALNNTEVPVAKGTSGILIMTQKESLRSVTVHCIRCSKCVSVCPLGLEPYLLAQLAFLKKYEEAEKEKIMDCMECGSCMYICPSFRPLLDYIRLGKNQVGKIIRSRK